MKSPYQADGQLVIIDPATKTPELACFNHLSASTELRSTYHLPALHGFGSFSDMPQKIAGVIILGSGASVYDDLPWQEELHAWLQSRMIAHTPTLGLCYGHQAIAHIFGGQVEMVWGGQKAKGARQVAFRCDRLGLDLAPAPVVVSHREGVSRCPEDFELIGFSDESPTEAMRHNHLPIWGVQAHVEAVGGFIENNEIPLSASPETFAQGHRVVHAFLTFVDTLWRSNRHASQ